MVGLSLVITEVSRVALGGRIPAVYDQRYNCHNLRWWPSSTGDHMFTTPRLLHRQQQAYRLRIAISTYPTCIRRGFRQNIAIPFGMEKLEWCGYIFIDIFIRFDTIYERDRHTHRQTDTQTPHDDIGRAYASHRAAKMISRITLVREILTFYVIAFIEIGL